MSEFRNKIAQFADIDENVSFARLTTMKVGGKARYVVYPYDEFALEGIIEVCRENGVEYKMRAIANGKGRYDMVVMTCYGTSYGNGDASHRLVLFANRI